MSFVVDASMAAAWILPDEANIHSDRLLSRLIEGTAAAPTLFWHETRNLMVTAERRKRIDAGGALEYLSEIRSLSIRDCGAGDDRRIIDLALARNLTAYDAAYLALAVSERLPLATLDRKLAYAAEAEGVPVLGPLSSG